MPAIRAITVSVGYAELLAITLPRNLRHFVECLVVSSPEDHATAELVSRTAGARLFITDAFTRHGAAFNKGLALEEGFDQLGRRGLMLILDADILLPDTLELGGLRPRGIHGARRRMLEDVSAWSPDLDWSALPLSRDGGPVGYFQLFSAEDPAIAGRRPWYDVSFAHAGGGDAYFMERWNPGERFTLPIDCLHLGPKDSHWFGTSAEAREIMAAFVVRNGWTASHPRVDRSAVDRVGEILERVEVPGYPPSNYELPFVRRAQAVKASQGRR
jgi:hypothetical protein